MITAEEMQAAQVITGVSLVAFLLAGRMGRDGQRIRMAILILYLLAATVLVAWVAIR